METILKKKKKKSVLILLSTCYDVCSKLVAENKYVTETCAAELMSGLQIRGKKANTKQEHGFRCKMTEV